MRVGQARKRDRNEPDIKEALEAAGALVLQLSAKGQPDLMARYRGVWYPLEVKSMVGRQTQAQTETDWPIVRTIDEAMQAIGASR